MKTQNIESTPVKYEEQLHFTGQAKFGKHEKSCLRQSPQRRRENQTGSTRQRRASRINKMGDVHHAYAFSHFQWLF
jgi:hypothetical protein